MESTISPAARLLTWWRRLQPVPGGRWLFGRLLDRGIPYTGTIRPRVLAVEPGFARVEMRDRRRVRNHLQSVHAIALTNLGELTTGLAVTATLPPDVRSILKALHVDFLKKARGTLIAECTCSAPNVPQTIDYDVSSSITDAAGDVVATVTATWRLSPPA